MKKVIIIGGGVAGMTAAHELGERGFEVHVYEKHPVYPGGKARSSRVEGTSINGSQELPGEHGFRFFPRFYKHIPDTMRRIPFHGNPNGVFDNLVETTQMWICSSNLPPIISIDRLPRSLDELKTLFNELHVHVGFAPGELDFFAEKFWQLMTSCNERRERDYEKIPWWNFIEAASKSAVFQQYLAIGVTRSLVALQAQKASTKTAGDILVQLVLDILTPGVSADRVLNGPTNDVWIQPWLDHIKSYGVTYNYDSVCTDITCENGVIQKVTVKQGDNTFDVTGDYYLFAVPVEVFAGLIEKNEAINNAAPYLAYLQLLKLNVAWMTGIQFYLNEDVELAHGHNIFIDSPWAVTAISQKQFWPGVDFSLMYDGTVKTILSVDVSNWDQKVYLTDPVTGETEYHSAMECCSKDELANEIWKQLKEEVNKPGKIILKDEQKVAYHLDKDIDFHSPGDLTNAEPLLVNQVTTWYMRPESYTEIPNLFIAGDYIKTFTDLATMEGANESARRAVNCILDACNSSAPYCEIWDLHEPDILGPWRKHDQDRFNKGMPWNGDILRHTVVEEAADGMKQAVEGTENLMRNAITSIKDKL